jgi:hypothetical protein
MTKKIMTIALAVFALAALAAPALAAKSPHRYSPRHGAKCRKSYRRVKHGRKVYCVRKVVRAVPKSPPPPQATTDAIKLHAHLDPTYTRNPLDPFEVTYAYSASATQQTFAESVALGAVESAPLPSGVLSFFSDGKLECAVNVGSGIEGSECPVRYSALGSHTVTTIYASGEQSATETETESIAPLATETTLNMSYSPEAPVEAGVASGLWRVGTVSAESGASPSPAHSVIGCGGPAMTERLDGSGCYQLGAATSYVFVETSGTCLTKVYVSKETGEPGMVGGASKVMAEGIPAAAIEGGVDHVRATVTAGAGYAGSEATAALRLDPVYEGQHGC